MRLNNWVPSLCTNPLINTESSSFLLLQLATGPQECKQIHQESLWGKKLVFITYNGTFYIFILFFKIFHQIGMVISYILVGNQNLESLTRLNNLIQIK